MAGRGAEDNNEVRLPIPYGDLKHGQTIKQELVQILHNTEWFTKTKINFELQNVANGDVVILVKGTRNDINIAVNIILRRLVKSFDQEKDLPEGVIPLTIENLKKHDKTDVAKRQFACEPCDNPWWKYVLEYKPVSRCTRCNVHYKAIPRDKEFGPARFICPECGTPFIGWGQRGVSSPCYHCGAVVFPGEFGIRRPFHGRRGTNKHACARCENGRIQPCPVYRKIIVASEVHHETGSTADTFITQQTYT